MTQLQYEIFNLLTVRLVPFHLPSNDVERLSADVWLISQEEPERRTASANTLVSLWAQRLGGLKNAASYLSVLRAGDRRRFQPEDSADRAERALRVE